MFSTYKNSNIKKELDRLCIIIYKYVNITFVARVLQHYETSIKDI